ncbi:MAG: replication/maintenance protein RepL [Bacilli bacterium]|nr:replication/maintenance protein RepL [Bacilli bacterium]
MSGITTIHTSCIDEFIMFFFRSIPSLMQLDGNTLKVLLWCWKYSSISPCNKSNVFYNNVIFRNALCEASNDTLTHSIINKAICTCNKLGIIVKKTKGYYELNPDYFYKGLLTDRAKLLLQVQYEPTENKNFDNEKKEN